jgi:hypothetical protein
MALLILVLAGLLVWAGTLSPADARRDFPSEDEVGPNRDAYVGERVTLSGTVVGTDPPVVDVEYGTGESFRATLADADQSVSAGDRVSAFGRLEPSSTLVVERVIVREPWELWYMYGVSFLGGLWVLVRTLRRWRFDAEQLAFVPRERPLWGGRDA